MSLRVIRIAAGAALQDRGRTGLRHLGMPPGGAFDRTSHAVANALAGNSPDAPTLEIPLMGGVFQALATVRLGVAGACAEVRRDGDALRAPCAFSARPGQSVALEPGDGVRCYLAVASGWVGVELGGSVSGTPVLAGDVLEAQGDAGSSAPDLEWDAAGLQALTETPLRVLPTVEGAGVLDRLCAAPRSVSLHSDRRGVRLESDVRGAPELAQSEPTCVGAVQWTPGGQAIIVGPDGPTIGGYLRIGSVCEADLDRVAQLRPLQQVSLRPSGLEECRRAWFASLNALTQAVAQIQARLG